jgi:hypothetical protein
MDDVAACAVAKMVGKCADCGRKPLLSERWSILNT